MRLRVSNSVGIMFLIAILPILLPTLGQSAYRSIFADKVATVEVTFECANLDANPPVCTPQIAGEPDSVWQRANFYAEFTTYDNGPPESESRSAIDNPMATNSGAECDFDGGVNRLDLTADASYSFSCIQYPLVLRRYKWSRQFALVFFPIPFIVGFLLLRRRRSRREADAPGVRIVR